MASPVTPSTTPDSCPPELISPNASSNSKTQSDTLKEVHKENLRAIDRLQGALDKFQTTLKNPADRKRLLMKLALYLGETVLIVLITSKISHPIWAMLVGVILGFVLTVLIEKILRKRSIKENMGEARLDNQRMLIQAILSNLSCIPEPLQDNIASLIYKGETAKLYLQVRKMKKLRELMTNFLNARKKFRDEKYLESKNELEKVISIAEKYELTELNEEANYLLKNIPVVEFN